MQHGFTSKIRIGPVAGIARHYIRPNGERIPAMKVYLSACQIQTNKDRVANTDDCYLTSSD